MGAAGHTDDIALSARLRRALGAVAGLLAIATVVGIAVLRPGAPVERAVDLGELFDAHLQAVEEGPCPGSEPGEVTCLFGTVRLLQGPDAGSTRQIELPVGADAPRFTAGERVVVSYYDNPEAVAAGVQYALADRDRKPALLWLAIVFALAVIVLGRVRGLAALAGLGASLAILVTFVLPAILAGRSPVLVAVVGAAAIAFVALYATHGFGARTTVALLGTLTCLGLAAALGALFSELAALTGRASEEASVLGALGPNVDFHGIFLAGLIIGALGALDDVTVTQASAVWELRAADPAMERRALVRAGMRIGRDHVGSAVNTLALAYAGSSMALMLLFVLAQSDLAHVANGEVVAVEIVRTLVGSVALVAAVPITTFLAAVVAGPHRRPAGP